ncbi:hypothetical protein BGX27_011173, partial [Mortierella sp. AM989]
MSTASSSSSNTQSSQSSESSSLSDTSSTTTLSSGILTPLGPNTSTVVDISCPPCMSSFPIDGKDSKCSRRDNTYTRSGADATETTESIDHLKIGQNRATTVTIATTLPSPPPSPLFSSTRNLSQSQAESSISSAVHYAYPRRSQKKSTKSTRNKSDKIARRQRRTKAFSVATLLSISLTMILLSLLQNRRRNLKKLSQQSQFQSQEQTENCITDSSIDDYRRYLSSRSMQSNEENNQASLPAASSLSAEETATMDRFAVSEAKDDHISAWLERQDIYGHDFAIESLFHETGDMIRVDEQSIFFPQNTKNSNSLIFTSQHRRTLSLVNPDISVMSQPHLYSTQENFSDRSTDPCEQLQHYRVQHFPYVDHLAQTHSSPHRRHTSLPPVPFAYGPPTRSADELAWERHYYYQRLQYEEEEQALRALQKKLQDQTRVSSTRQFNQETVVRASSLNKLAAPSLLSNETSRLLGLCRSTTPSSRTDKRASLIEKDFDKHLVNSGVFSSPSPRSVASKSQDTTAVVTMIRRSGSIKDGIHAETLQTEPVIMATTLSAPTSLSRRKTLKDHLAPPLRSLARHCSSRFGGRPNSFAGTK